MNTERFLTVTEKDRFLHEGALACSRAAGGKSGKVAVGSHQCLEEKGIMASYQRIGGVKRWIWGVAGAFWLGAIASPALAQIPHEDPLQRADVLEQEMLFLFADESYGEMIPLAEEVLGIYREVYGAFHPVVAASMNHLAGLYATAGRYDEAEALYLQAIALRRSLFGDNHIDVAISLGHLAQLYETVGRQIEAAALYRWEQQIREQQL